MVHEVSANAIVQTMPTAKTKRAATASSSRYTKRLRATIITILLVAVHAVTSYFSTLSSAISPYMTFTADAWRVLGTKTEIENHQIQRDNGKDGNSPRIQSSPLADIEEHETYHTNSTTLALLSPPGLIGGYRNQVMRFVAFVAHAQARGHEQILLPSIHWTTRFAQNQYRYFFPVPMSLLFDVAHWNEYVQNMSDSTETTHLPRLVTTVHDSDCWTNVPLKIPVGSIDGSLTERRNNASEALDAAYRLRNPNAQTKQLPTLVLSQLLNESFTSPLSKHLSDHPSYPTPIADAVSAVSPELWHPRKTNLMPAVEHCTRPFVHGGSAQLWSDYMRTSTMLHRDVSRALQPAPQWRRAAQRCIAAHVDNGGGYVALHARVEVEMMEHRCGRNMVKNLTSIVNMVEDFANHSYSGIFLAVSRDGINATARNSHTQAQAEENYEFLLSRSETNVDKARKRRKLVLSNNTESEQPILFECGELWMDHWYKASGEFDEYRGNHDPFGNIVPSIVNFYIAIHASIFVGVARSSWSTDVWTTRYHLGKGDRNFQYTESGIVQVENGGLPSPHTNC